MQKPNLPITSFVKPSLLFCAVICAAPMIYAHDGAHIETARKKVDRGDFKTAMLKAHNEERKLLKATPLIWSESLAKDASNWAKHLSTTGKFEHAYVELGKNKQGENLWMGTNYAFSYSEMAGFWLDERRMFKAGRFPDISTTGQWSDVGHYTQLIWPLTQKVGCALSKNHSDEYLVCRYFPAGNVMGFKLESKRP